MIVRRTRLATGGVIDTEVQTLRQAEALVAWCATDNLHMTRPLASAAAVLAGKAFRGGAVYVLEEQYRFRLITDESEVAP